ncbi:MAG TPA: ATP-binding cassette domain-containing protein [Bacteroidota bacterium]|nr:ATP-binding cassette domain-containing protein [Bacteroidota bacterium]
MKPFEISIAQDGRPLIAVAGYPVAEGVLTILFGESGIGKSLSALAVAGLVEPAELTISVDRESYAHYLARGDVREYRASGFFVFQEPSSHLNPLMTLRRQLNEGSLARATNEPDVIRRLWQGNEQEAASILDVYPKPYRPSGGEKQRVLAAMAFKKMSLLRPGSSGFFVFDEPTASLDNRLRDEFIDLLVDYLPQAPAAVLLITHDYSIVARLTRRHARLSGKVAFKEMYLVRGKQEVRDFEPREYLGWVSSLKPLGPGTAPAEFVLRVASGMRVLSRSYRFVRKEGDANAATLTVYKGRMTYLKGGSGLGKTTVLKTIMGLFEPEKMVVEIGGRRFTRENRRKDWSRSVWGRKMTMVFQHADEALNQRALVRDVFGGLPGFESSERNMLDALAKLFDAEAEGSFLNRPVYTLSGGQKQRLNLVRSMILQTEILLLDEPLSGLDLKASAKVIHLLEQQLARGSAILVVSHNEDIFDALTRPEDVYLLEGHKEGP